MRELFTAEEVLTATGGQWAVEPSGTSSVARVAIDSRDVTAGSLFVALAGALTDGHEYLGEAACSGAVLLLVARSEWPARRPECEAASERHGAGAILVDNTLRALQDLALFHLRRFPDLTIIGVTGSNGKTTTKEIIGCILAETAVTATNPGNLNSETGLPLAVFRVEPHHRYAVFEMAMNHPGEMDALVRIVKPDAALITNIGTAHIEFLGSKQEVAREKKNIFRYFKGREKAFIFEGEAFYSYLSEGVKGKIIPFGPDTTRGFTGSQDLGLDGTIIYWEGLQVRFSLFGRHNLLNALGAITLCTALGAGKHAVKAGLENVRPLFGRSQIIRSVVTVIQDCYNANPDSMVCVLDFFSALNWPGRKVVVLGSMLELGEESARAHLDIGDHAAAMKFDLIFFYGKEMRAAAELFGKRCQGIKFVWTDDFEILLREVKAQARAGDIVLIKGSRGARLERLLEPLLETAA